MSVLDNQPSNKNLLSPLGFKFVLNKISTCNYFSYNVSLPTLSLGDFDTENPFVRLPYTGDKLRYEPFNITFRVDEDLQNYLEIHNWLISLGYPEAFGQSAHDSVLSGSAFKSKNVFSDGKLYIMSSNKNPSLEITFRDMFPMGITELSFDATLNDVDYLTATATFRYAIYTIKKLPN